MIRFIARRYLFSRKQISLISILTGISIAGITIGTALLIIVLSVFNGFYDVVQGFLLSFDPDIRIEHSEARVLPADSLFMARLASHPDVVRVSPYIEEKAMLMMPYDQADVVTVRGIDPERAVRFDDLMSTVKGRAENPVDGRVDSRLESRAGGEVPGENRVADHVEEVGRGDERTRATSGNKDRSNGIREELGRGDADADWAAGKKSGVTHSVPLRPGNMLINENLNLKYGVQTGDAVALIGADGLRRSVTRLSPPRMQRFDVTGIYEMRQILEGDRVYIDLLSAQQVFRMPREVSGYELELRRPDDAERVREELLEWIFGDAGAEGRVPGDVFAGGGATEGVVVERGALVGSAAGGGAVEGGAVERGVMEDGALVGSAVGRGAVERGVDPGAVGRGVDPGAVGVAGLRAQDLKISTWYDLQKPLYDVMELEKWGSFIILMIIIFVAVLNIVGSMTMMVIQKKRDIGLLLAMGLTPAGIGKIFRMQGFQVGLIGCLLGGGIGLFLAKMQQMYGWVKLSSAFIIDAYPVVIEPSDVLLVFAGTMVLSVLASGYPAWRGGRTDPSVALRND